MIIHIICQGQKIDINYMVISNSNINVVNLNDIFINTHLKNDEFHPFWYMK